MKLDKHIERLLELATVAGKDPSEIDVAVFALPGANCNFQEASAELQGCTKSCDGEWTSYYDKENETTVINVY